MPQLKNTGLLRREKLRGYQKRAVRFVKGNEQAGLFLDMGLGKTVSTLTALSDLLAEGKITRVLLIGPLKVVQGVWRQEARKWEHLRHLTFKLLHGSEEARLRGLQSKAQIHLINVENVRWLLFVLRHLSRRKGFEWPYDVLVVDESSMFKRPSTKRFTTIRHVVENFRRRYILTGTPAPNGLLDVWAQMYLVDKGHRLGSTFGRYKSRFFEAGGFRGKQYEPVPGAKETIARLISPVVLTLRSEDWLDLPPLIKENVWVELPPNVRSMYDRMENEMFLELETGKAEITHAGSLMTKCHQIANGAVYLEGKNGERVWEAVHEEKLVALREILDNVGSNALIAYYFKPDLERLRKAYPKAPCLADCKNDRDLTRVQREWNAGEHPVMLVHPQSAGHGLNLQDGGHLLVFYSLLFSHEPYRQVIERIGPARQVGKAKRVLVKHILTRDTVDEALLLSQQRKYDDERGFVTAVKEYRDIRGMLG